MENNTEHEDDFYNLNSSMRDSAKHLTREYKKLHHIMKNCNKLSSNLINDLNPMQSRFNSLNEMINKTLQYTVKSLANNFFNTKSGGGSFASSMGQALGNVFGGVRATGGNVSSGTSYMVGERGAEMFIPNQSGYIVPNNAVSSNGAVNIVMNISTPDVGSFQRSQGQIFAQAARAMQKASRSL